MKAFRKCHGIMIPLALTNVDTDKIIPKQYLKTVLRSGLGAYLFDEIRFADQGFPGKAAANRKPKQDFILNQEPYNQGQILITGANFGCGSSREHAVWSLMDFGIQVVIAPSFAEIFSINCSKNGLLTIELPQDKIDVLMSIAKENPGTKAEVDLMQQSLVIESTSSGRSKHQEHSAPDTPLTYEFEIDAMSKKIFIEGLDDIALSLDSAAAIKSFEDKHHKSYPWLAQDIRGI